MTVHLYTGGAKVTVIDEALPAPPVDPTITDFAATPDAINAGESSTLDAVVANAASLELNGVAIPSLPHVVTPALTTAYALTAIGEPGTTPATAQATVTVTATQPPDHPLDSVPPLTWYEAPGSAVSNSGVMFQYPSGYYFGNTPSMRFLTESGASYDSKRDRVIVWGGGHADYAGNEIYVFDIPTLKWERINDPSPRFDSAGTIQGTGYYPDAAGAPDQQQPRSRHTYWAAVYVPNIDRFLSIAGYSCFPGNNGGGTNAVDVFDFDTKLWTKKANGPFSAGLNVSVPDPATGRVWHMGNRGGGGWLTEYDPVADTYTKRTTNAQGVKSQSAPALDTKRHRLVFIGQGEVRYFDLDATGMLISKLAPVTGDGQIVNRPRLGFAYDPINDKLVAYSGVEAGGTRDIYIVDPDTWVITKTTLGGPTAPAVSATTDTGGWFGGIYGRLAYISSQQAFIVITNRLAHKVFFFKLG